MFVALRGGLAAKLSFSPISKELCKITTSNNVNKYQVANLTRAAFRDESEVPNIKPFPYHEKDYHVFNMLIDTNKCRVHKHSKLIVIDGPPAVGKNQLAQDLAKELDFLFLPQPTFDDLFISHWGFDLRTLDSKLPKNIQTWDIERFCQDPHDINTTSMQHYMFLMRQHRYMNALAHIFCTGQGVVTIRSPWSDAVFAKAMCQSGYTTKNALEFHTDCGLASLWFYLKPHLIIYLDTPVDKVLQNLKKRGRKYEQNSKALTEKYLSDIEENYKRDYLAKLSEHTPLLIYDWSQGGDSEVVLEDIENINFDNISERDPKLSDWRFNAYQWKVYTKHYTYDWDQLLFNNDIMRTDVPEMWITGNEMEAWDDEWSKIPDSFYDIGYNVERGEKGVMWNNKMVLGKDYVTPLMKKYYERKEREKSGRKSEAAA